MTQEDKQLLLTDLCARLPYMPKIKITYQQQGIKGTDEGRVSCDFIEKIVNDLRNGVITDMQIYLRPMSSMTGNEKKEYYNLCETCVGYDGKYSQIKIFDWLNKNMFDYRDLIPKGLAIKASEGMYEEE